MKMKSTASTYIWMLAVIVVTALLIVILKIKASKEPYCGGGGCGGNNQNLGAIQVSETPNGGGIYAVMPTVYAMTI